MFKIDMGLDLSVSPLVQRSYQMSNMYPKDDSCYLLVSSFNIGSFWNYSIYLPFDVTID